MFKYAIKISLIYFLLQFTYNNSFSQIAGNYPLGITPFIFPPYPSSIKYLSQSVTPSLILTITNKSTNTQLLNVRIATSIKAGNFTAVSTPVVAGLSPITISGGIPVRLTNVDLAPLFAFGNLTGITLSQFENAFPESKVTFAFILYDVVTGKQLRDNVTYAVTYSINYPPILTLPVNKSNIIERGSQNILFQWQPRQSTGVNGTQYTFQIIELLTATQDQNSAFLSNKPFFTDSTFANRYVYGADQPLLLPGKSYAWRVQAKPYDNGGFSVSNYQNNGYSNVGSFRYLANCKSASQLIVDNLSNTSATARWSSMPENQNFVLSFRKRGDNWKDITLNGLSDPSYSIEGLDPVTQYEMKVLTVCPGGISAISIVKSFTTTSLETAVLTASGATVVSKDSVKEVKKVYLSTANLKEIKPTKDKMGIKKLTTYISRQYKYIELRWKSNDKGINSFMLFRAAPREEFTLIATIPGNKRVFVDEKIKLNTDYKYGIAVIYDDGRSSKIKNVDLPF